MDFPGLVRRLSSLSDDGSTASTGRNSFSSNMSGPHSVPRGGSGLTVDTSLMKKASSFREMSGDGSGAAYSPEPQWTPNEERTTPVHSSRTATPTSARHEDNEKHLRRRRSHSECLMLAKNGATLPGPCKEYISSVKQILARSEDSKIPRPRSMSLRNSPVA